MNAAKLCVACVLSTTPAWADDDIAVSVGPPLAVQLTPALEQQESVYKQTVGRLTPEQQATLKSYQSQYLDLFQPAIRRTRLEYQLKYCLSRSGSEIANNAAKYQSEFSYTREIATNTDNAAIRTVRARQMRDAPFIDQKVADDHMKFMFRLTVAIARASLEADYQKGAFSNTDCNATAQTLEKMHAGAEERQTKDTFALVKAGAANGDPEAMTILAMAMLSGTPMVAKDVDGGFAMLERAANSGYAQAQYDLGLAFAAGVNGRPRDKTKAKYWLAKAAAQKYKDAAEILPQIDKMAAPESVESLRARAAKGDAGAEYELGMYYAQGWGGLAKDLDKALPLYLASANQGNVSAESDVALLLLSANRVSEGLAYMTKAAEAGNANSQISLAGLYVDGEYVTRDLAKARYWYEKAAAQGDPRAKQRMQDLGLN